MGYNIVITQSSFDVAPSGDWADGPRGWARWFGAVSPGLWFRLVILNFGI